MPESESSSSGLFSTEQLHVTMFIGAASAQIIRCCHVAVQGSAQGTTDEERRRSIDGVVAKVDVTAGVAMADELAAVMYEAACLHLISRNLPYPPLRPATFMGLEKFAQAGGEAKEGETTQS